MINYGQESKPLISKQSTTFYSINCTRHIAAAQNAELHHYVLIPPRQNITLRAPQNHNKKVTSPSKAVVGLDDGDCRTTPTRN